MGKVRGLARAAFGSAVARLGAFGCAARGLRVRGCTARRLRPPTLSTLWPRPPVCHQSTRPIRFHLLRYPSFVDKNRRYVSLPSPRRRRVQKVRSCDLAFCGKAATLLIGQLESDSHIDDYCPRRATFKERKRGDRLALAETLRKQSCSIVDEIQRQAS